jgi:c-di-GMP-binding flagellar brake protein YcgR
MEERRVNPRLQINQAAGLTIEGSPSTIPCTVEDISEGGMRVSLGRRLFPEIFSNVTFALTENFGFNVGAAVRWQEEAEGRSTYGLMFNRIDEPDRRWIAQYVNSSMEEEAKNRWWRGF